MTAEDLKAYRLKNGDITVCNGGWILLRWFKATDRILIISPDAPAGWIDDAMAFLEREKTK